MVMHVSINSLNGSTRKLRVFGCQTRLKSIKVVSVAPMPSQAATREVQSKFVVEQEWLVAKAVQEAFAYAVAIQLALITSSTWLNLKQTYWRQWIFQLTTSLQASTAAIVKMIWPQLQRQLTRHLVGKLQLLKATKVAPEIDTWIVPLSLVQAR